MERIKLKADLSAKKVFRTEELSWRDFDKVGSKAANYAELAKALNTPERTVVNPGFAIPFFFYQQFIDMNPAIKAEINKVIRDPAMNILTNTEYRKAKLDAIQAMILAEDNVVSQELIDALIAAFDQVKDENGVPKKMKLRSSTNSEDLPNFNGAGLYTSESYKPQKDGKEKSYEKKTEALKETLRIVWASVWNLRAFEERSFFQIPHAQVKMGMQVNPSFSTEDVDGVVITKNIINDPKLSGKGVYIEAQRGDTFSVANPDPGIKPERILVLIDVKKPLDKSAYRINILQKSNIADDMETILPQDNPKPIMSDDEIKDLVFQVMKAEGHFKPLLGADKDDFSLDLEFKVDAGSGQRQVYLKQARPYLN
jgi:phosphoenolpyruvate synthase/pyruvate phosphate dikinase